MQSAVTQLDPARRTSSGSPVSEPSYCQGGVKVYRSGSNFVLSYMLHNRRMEEVLPLGALSTRGDDIRDERIGVHAWFDPATHNWIVVHTYLLNDNESLEWHTDTIFLHPEGTMDVRCGYDAGGIVDLESQFYVIALVLAIAFAIFGVFKVLQYGFTQAL